MIEKLDIPDEELERFQKYLRVFAPGRVIVKEGQTTDQCLFFLRQGKVEITKEIAGKTHSLGFYEAECFFGELALVRKRPRHATVTAVSDPVAVYAFPNPNFSVFLANPTWGMLLLKRLSDTLGEMLELYEKSELEKSQLESELAEARRSIRMLRAGGSPPEEPPK